MRVTQQFQIRSLVTRVRLSEVCIIPTERHARALLRLPDEEERLRVIGLIVQGEWTVAKTEQYIDARLAPEIFLTRLTFYYTRF